MISTARIDINEQFGQAWWAVEYCHTKRFFATRFTAHTKVRENAHSLNSIDQTRALRDIQMSQSNKCHHLSQKSLKKCMALS